MIVAHVGFGKTATTTLQKVAFPLLARRGVVGTFNHPALMECATDIVHLRRAPAEFRRLCADHDRPFLSLEVLVEWDPLLWSSALARNVEMFSPDATIILTLRHPVQYLRSLFQQKVQAGNVIPPEMFFLRADQYGIVEHMLRHGELDAIDTDGFDLESIVRAYAASFRRTVVVSMEAYETMAFVGAVWPDASAEDVRACRDAFRAAPRENASFSDLAMRLTFARERLLNALGLRSLGSNDVSLARNLGRTAPGQALAVPFRRLSPADALAQLPARLLRGTVGATGWHRLMLLLSRHVSSRPYRLPAEAELERALGPAIRFYDGISRAPGGFRVYGADGLAGQVP